MASKSSPADQILDIEEALDYIDKSMERIKTLYEQYFLGMQKQPPSHLHNDIERRIRDLMQVQIRNTGMRYRFATLQQKFGSYNSYWRRTLRQIENGTYIRQLAKIGRRAAETGEEIPEEILAAMPKRMREQVKRDRDAAVAIARRRAEAQGLEFGGGGTVDTSDDAALITDAGQDLGQIRNQKKLGHVLDEADADMDFDAFFASMKEPAGGDFGPDDTNPDAKPFPEPAPVRAAVAKPTPAPRLPPVAPKATFLPAETVPSATVIGLDDEDEATTFSAGPPSMMPPARPSAPPQRVAGALPGTPPPQRVPGALPGTPPPQRVAGALPGTPPPQRAPSVPPVGPPQRQTGPIPAQAPPFAQQPTRTTGQQPVLPPTRQTGPVPVVPPQPPQRASQPIPTQPPARMPPQPPQRASQPIPTQPPQRAPSVPPQPPPRQTPMPGAYGAPPEQPQRPKFIEPNKSGTVPGVAAPQPSPSRISGATPVVPASRDSGPIPVVTTNTGPNPAVPRPAVAPSQVTRPNPIQPGASQQRGAVPVQSMQGPFPRSPGGAPRPERPDPPMRPPPGMNDADVNALYAKYVQAKQAVGDDPGPGAYGKLLKTINAQAPKIMEQYKAKGVEFSVVVKDNQVIIKAKPKP